MALDKQKESVKRLLQKTKKGKKDDLWPFLKNKFDVGMDIRRSYERGWLITLAFLAGRQYTFFNATAHMIQQLKLPKGKWRIVDNKLLPRYRRQVARMIANNPLMTVVADTNDEEDVEAANVGTKVLKSFWRQDKMNKKLRRLAGWVYGTGNGFLDDRWNPKKGPIVLDEKKAEITYLGDVECGVWSPLEILVPASGIGDVDLHEFSWLIKHKFRTLKWIETNHPKRGKEVSAEERPSRITDAVNLIGGEATINTEEEGAMVIELRMKPNGEYPKGLFLTGANGVILHKDDYPYDNYHIEHFKDIEIPGLFWGIATASVGIWQQKLWNRTATDLAEFNRTMAKGKFLVPKGSALETAPDDEHGQLILYKPVLGHKPEQMKITTLPRTYELTFSIIGQALMELFFQHEVTQGTNKSDIRSGEMVQLLQEYDDKGNIPTHAVFEESLEAAMQRVLLRIQSGYSTERMMKIQGRDGDFEVFSFKGADLRGNTDVHVKKESSLPDSRVARQGQIMMRYEKGLYGNPDDPEVRRHVMNMLDDAVIKDVFGDTHLDEQNATLENRTMMSSPGTELVPNDYDDHFIHDKSHGRHMKSRQYQKKKFDDPKGFMILEAGFLKHRGYHRAFIEEQMKAEESRLRVLKGGKGGGS